MLGNVSDLPSLVNYCTAEESGKCVGQTVGGGDQSQEWMSERGADTTPLSLCFMWREAAWVRQEG